MITGEKGFVVWRLYIKEKTRRQIFPTSGKIQRHFARKSYNTNFLFKKWLEMRALSNSFNCLIWQLVPVIKSANVILHDGKICSIVFMQRIHYFQFSLSLTVKLLHFWFINQLAFQNFFF